jgi:hypothetical protein
MLQWDDLGGRGTAAGSGVFLAFWVSTTAAGEEQAGLQYLSVEAHRVPALQLRKSAAPVAQNNSGSTFHVSSVVPCAPSVCFCCRRALAENWMYQTTPSFMFTCLPLRHACLSAVCWLYRIVYRRWAIPGRHLDVQPEQAGLDSTQPQ